MLETEIKKLTAAVEANTAALLGGAAPAAAAAPAAVPAAQAAPAASAPVVVPTPEPAPVVEPAPAGEVTMKEITAKILALGKAKGRQAAVQILSEYGATKVPELKRDPSKFGEIVVKIDALLAA